jgi:hypothetical protein
MGCARRGGLELRRVRGWAHAGRGLCVAVWPGVAARARRGVCCTGGGLREVAVGRKF